MAEPPTNEHDWLNPIGGVGDMLMLSGVLKHVVDRDPTRKFNLVRRTNYAAVLGGHPAIAQIGHPHRGARIKNVDYWAMEELGPGSQRAYQVLARSFGLPTPIEESLYLPDQDVDDSVLHDVIPWRRVNIMIAPASDSPRKVMPPGLWHRLVEMLRADGVLVLQVGRSKDRRIRNAYSLLGLTSVRQLVALMKKCQAVVTSDNLIMHAAHMVAARTVVVWGATRHTVYGYPEQRHIQMPRTCGLAPDEDCVGAGEHKGAKIYGSPCPVGERHCLAQLRPEELHQAVRTVLEC